MATYLLAYLVLYVALIVSLVVLNLVVVTPLSSLANQLPHLPVLQVDVLQCVQYQPVHLVLLLFVMMVLHTFAQSDKLPAAVLACLVVNQLLPAWLTLALVHVHYLQVPALLHLLLPVLQDVYLHLKLVKIMAALVLILISVSVLTVLLPVHLLLPVVLLLLLVPLVVLLSALVLVLD